MTAAVGNGTTVIALPPVTHAAQRCRFWPIFTCFGVWMVPAGSGSLHGGHPCAIVEHIRDAAGVPDPFIDQVTESGRYCLNGGSRPIDRVALVLEPIRVAAEHALVSGPPRAWPRSASRRPSPRA